MAEPKVVLQLLDEHGNERDAYDWEFENQAEARQAFANACDALNAEFGTEMEEGDGKEPDEELEVELDAAGEDDDE